jgi:hypothetical protein
LEWLVAVALVVASMTACGSGSPETASNAVIDVAHYSLDAKDVPRAYDRLCAAQRAAVPRSEFERTAGGAVSPIFTRHGWGSVDGTEEPRDFETLNPEVTEATRVFRVQRSTGPGALDFLYEEWSIDLVREDGGWRLCAFKLLDTYPEVENSEARCPNSRVKGCP